MKVTTPKEYADYEWAVNLNRFCLRLIGIWPDDDRGARKLSIKLYVTAILLLMTFVCLIPCLCSLIFKCKNLLAAIDNLGYVIPFLITQMKFATIYNKREVLLPVINMIAEDWAKAKTDAEKGVMIRRARIGRVFSGFFYVCAFLLLLWLLVVPRFGVKTRYLTNETDVRKSFPIPTYYLRDISQSPYFEIVLAAQAVTVAITILCYTGVDSFFGMLILHICGQLENLRTRLATIKDSERFDRALAATVNDHTRLIRAIDAIEDTFTLLLLLVLLYFVIYLCVTGLLVVNIILEGGDIPLSWLLCMLCCVANTALQTALYCAMGQVLVSQSEGVYEAVYECEWLNLKPKEAKGLIMIMMRAKKPLYVTAGKIFPMMMLTFCNILKISFSYISFLMTKL
ncbi:odorant receptor 10-like [Andrena cerasifolii]|uniref:odorant receptor 10-like n=1 Tax=Andrena cerasifolii TaxID=2819439 RepID=UPI0040377CEA